MSRTAGTSAGLEQLRRRIERWRMSRAAPGQMPEPLWAAAAELARRQGVSRVASALGLGYAGLKQRVEVPLERVTSSASGERKTGFVEVTGAQLLSSASPGSALVEYAARDGSRLRVTLPAASSVDVAALLLALRGA